MSTLLKKDDPDPVGIAINLIEEKLKTSKNLTAIDRKKIFQSCAEEAIRLCGYNYSIGLCNQIKSSAGRILSNRRWKRPDEEKISWKEIEKQLQDESFEKMNLEANLHICPIN